MRCPRRGETRAQVASAGMPASGAQAWPSVAGHLCPCQAKSPLSSRLSAHATLRLNPPSLFSSVQSPGPPPSSRQAWLGAIRGLAPGWCRWVRLAASDTAQGPAAGRRRRPRAPAGVRRRVRLGSARLRRACAAAPGSPAAPAAAAVAPARLGRRARLRTLGPACGRPTRPTRKSGLSRAATSGQAPPPEGCLPRPHAARSGLLLRPQTTPAPAGVVSLSVLLPASVGYQSRPAQRQGKPPNRDEHRGASSR